MFEKRIVHPGLNAYRLVKGQTVSETEMKANLQQAIWEERWQKRLSAETVRNTRAKKLQQRSASVEQSAAAKALALEQTRELELIRENLEKLLQSALNRDARQDWEARKDRSRFSTSKPLRSAEGAPPPRPNPADMRFQATSFVPTISLLDNLLRRRKEEKLAAAEEMNAQAKLQASQRLEEAISTWERTVAAHKQFSAELDAAHMQDVRVWESQRDEFHARQKERNAQIDLEKANYLLGDHLAVVAYIEDVLSRSEYPDEFPKEHQLAFIPATKTLILDYELPNQTVLPAVKEIKYVAARAEFQAIPTSDAYIKKTYDEILYQLSLRTLFELFQSDDANVLVSVVFNGWVRSIDKATGAQVHACVMSLEARKDEFLAINLAQVDCKACFKKLKGVAASKLIELSPVKPLVLLNREDKRFVEGYAIVDALDERTNLAAMDWLDFENLIREVFEKEFSKGGGEVKITQASRDGGVDAVAFDPDPIRGGKLVIQAKRYTNTVGVSAVRDLYGTVHNEGANKGILVTTSDFGPDAYAFAKDKPLTLISGGELLYLLAQHGHSAKIDLADAKRIAAEATK